MCRVYQFNINLMIGADTLDIIIIIQVKVFIIETSNALLIFSIQ